MKKGEIFRIYWHLWVLNQELMWCCASKLFERKGQWNMFSEHTLNIKTIYWQDQNIKFEFQMRWTSDEQVSRHKGQKCKELYRKNNEKIFSMD